MKGKISMPNQEERLETVEREFWQFKAEAKDAYEEMALEVTMLKGLTEDSVKRLIKLERTLEQRFNRLESRFDEHSLLLNQILERLPKSR